MRGRIEPPESLNEDQRLAFDTAVNGRRSSFITGDAGTGKSHLLNEIVEAFTKASRRTIVVAPTGIAALNVGGVTVHRWAGITFDENVETSVDKIRRFKKTSAWTAVDTLVIDEISMLSGRILTLIDSIFRKLRKNYEAVPFGGVQIIAFGDFLQLQPVEKGVTNPKLCFESDAWNGVEKTCYLSTPVRQNDADFIRCLREIRMGYLSEECEKMLRCRLVASIDLVPSVSTILYSRVDQVERENTRRLALLPGEAFVYKGVLQSDGSAYGQRAVKALAASSKSPEILTLKMDAQIMVTANISLDDGLVNGARGVVTYLDESCVIIALDSNPRKHITLAPKKIERRDGLDRVPVTYTQYPLMLAYAITIHKAQGLTMTNFAVDMRSVFEAGQVYVAISRARRFEDFVIVGELAKDKIFASLKAKNYYLKLLSDGNCPNKTSHSECVGCNQEFCVTCSVPMDDFMKSVGVCRGCMEGDAPSKKSRLD